MDCWICGDRADSREHRFKASDLRLHVGNISQSQPLFKTPRDSRSKRIGSVTAKALKFDPTICVKCNNQNTQPYDRAWEKLSSYFFANREQLHRNQRWEPRKIFPGSARKDLINVQLFFLKIFGCRSIDLDTTIKLNELAECLRSGTPCSHFYISFGKTPGIKKR